MGDGPAARLDRRTLAVALDALPDGVILLRADWQIVHINPAATALLGRPTAELTGRSLLSGLPDIDGSDFHTFLLQAWSADSPSRWSGPYAALGRRLTASAVVVDGLLHVSLRAAEDPPEIQPAAHVEDGRVADADRLQFLAEVSEAMITTLDTGESASRLAELAASRLCDWAFVSLAGEDGGPGEETWAHRDPACLADLETYLTKRLRNTGDDVAMVDALLSGQPVQNAVREELVAPSLGTEEVREAWRRLATTSYTIVPLRARGETFGALALLNTGTRPPHTASEMSTAVEMGRRGALALDNARLYSRQLKVAETLQHSLLSAPPQPDELEIAVRYRPAASYQQVGGDWYDAFLQPDGATMLVIGDVVGHNVDAAAAMGQVRSILRGLAYDRPESPAGVLTRVDSVLTGLGIGTMATALLARVEQPPELAVDGTRRLRWSSAGHLPPLLQRADGTVQPLHSSPELLLGADSAGARSDHQALLHPGDVVVFYTDGLIEYGRTGIDEGISRLIGQLTELADQPLEKLCDQLLDRVAPGHTDDDIAILAVRCHPSDDRLR